LSHKKNVWQWEINLRVQDKKGFEAPCIFTREERGKKENKVPGLLKIPLYAK